MLDSLGWVHYRQGNLEEALGYIRRAADALPDGQILTHLGEVLWALGNREEAREVWRTGLEQNPSHPELLRAIERHGPGDSSSVEEDAPKRLQ